MQAPATLIERRGQYYCSKCMIRQRTLQEPYCDYCGAPFCNWEEVTMQLYLHSQSEELKHKEIK